MDETFCDPSKNLLASQHLNTCQGLTKAGGEDALESGQLIAAKIYEQTGKAIDVWLGCFPTVLYISSKSNSFSYHGF